MESPDHPVFADIEEDAGPAAGEAFARLVAGYFAEARSGAGPVSTPLRPEDLARRFEEPLPLAGRPLADVLARLRGQAIPDSNHLCHPRAMGHQVSAPLPVAVWAESLISALNQSAAVWEMSPVGTILEARATARALHEAISACPDFEALHEPESNILCFRYVGDGSLDPERLDRLNLRVREGYNRSGEGWITTTLLAGRRVLRVSVMNPRTTAADVEQTLQRLGERAARTA